MRLLLMPMCDVFSTVRATSEESVLLLMPMCDIFNALGVYIHERGVNLITPR